MSNNRKLQAAIEESKTIRFFCWIDVAWPNIKPLMLRLISHLNGAKNPETGQALQNILRATRLSVVHIHPSIDINQNQIDKEYLIIFYRGFFTSAVSELSKLHLTNATTRWNPLTENMSAWEYHNAPPHTFKRIKSRENKIFHGEVITLSKTLLTSHDRKILGDEISRIYTPYPFNNNHLK